MNLGNVYQLRSPSKKRKGESFWIGGPHDLWGVVVESTHEPGHGIHKHSYEWINLIRGVGSREPRGE